jgi:hypothetical protein
MAFATSPMNSTPIHDTSKTLQPIADALRALATAIETIAVAKPADEWIVLVPKQEIPGFGVNGRAVVDAAARGELVTAKFGGKRHVKRSELERWATSRRKAPKARAGQIDDAVDDYEALVSGGGR